MTYETDGWRRAIFAGILVGAALAIEHLVCYREEDFEQEPELVLLGSNVLGTATIAVGVAIAARSADEIARHITVAAVGGIVVIVLRIVRRFLRFGRHLHYEAGHGAGQIEGALSYDQTFRRNRARDIRD